MNISINEHLKSTSTIQYMKLSEFISHDKSQPQTGFLLVEISFVIQMDPVNESVRHKKTRTSTFINI
jgi:hypothetical protein